MLPPPANGTQYRKPEVADILARYPVKSRERGAVVDKMSKWQGYFVHMNCQLRNASHICLAVALDYIPRPRGETKDASLKRTIRRLMEKHAKGLPIGDSEWTMGKPVVLAGQPGESPQRESEGLGESGGTGKSHTMKKMVEHLHSIDTHVQIIAKCHVATLNAGLVLKEGTAMTAHAPVHYHSNGWLTEGVLVLEELITMNTGMCSRNLEKGEDWSPVHAFFFGDKPSSGHRRFLQRHAARRGQRH